MPTIVAEGSQVAVVGTIHYLLSDNTTNKSFVFEFDTSPMLLGDIIVLEVITKIRTGSPPNRAYGVMYSHKQGDPNKYSVPVPSDISYTATMLQSGGTGRTYDWKVVSL